MSADYAGAVERGIITELEAAQLERLDAVIGRAQTGSGLNELDDEPRFGLDDLAVPSEYDSFEALPRENGSEPPAEAAGLELRIVSAEDFAAIEEPGAEALVGENEAAALIPEDGDVMFYGNGGAGKTTLAIDLACHVAAGDDWLGIPVGRPARVLLIENEGPRPLFRAKLRRKLAGWTGSPVEDRLIVLESPWARLRFDELAGREAIAGAVRQAEVDVLIVGPLTASGMNAAGTLQQVREFMELVGQTRKLSGRRLVVVLIHHENKGGQVSGAWEPAGDTLFHVTGQGHGRTRLGIQKARWDSKRHATALNLLWAEGDGFTVEEKPELDDEGIVEKIIEAVDADPGMGVTKLEEATPGVGKERRKKVRDGLLADGRIVNVGKDENGQEVALDRVVERVPARLFLAHDPTISHLRRDSGAGGAQVLPFPDRGDS
jgi:hypothetical protein